MQKTDTSKLPANISIQKRFSNSMQISQYLQQLTTQLHTLGYIEASVDSIQKISPENQIFYLHGGPKYVWNDLIINSGDSLLLNHLNFKTKFFNRHQLVQTATMQQLTQTLLNHYENNGYPFAKVEFVNPSIQQHRLQATLAVHSGIYYVLDSIQLLGNAVINKQFIYRLLQLKPGAAYSKEKLDDIAEKINALAYLRQSKSHEIVMLGNKYVVKLPLQSVKSNQANALIGLLPATDASNGKMLLTGDVNVSLNNLFGNGEAIHFQWQQIQQASPRLNIGYENPFFLKRNWGIQLSANIFKKDSSFVNTNLQAGIVYRPGKRQTVTFGAAYFSTSVLWTDTNYVIATKQLPDIANTVSTQFLFQYHYNFTNNAFNPTAGAIIQVNTKVGTKQIKPAAAIVNLNQNGFDYTKLYQAVPLNSYTIVSKLSVEKYWPVGKANVIKAAFNAGWLQTPYVLRNELFQIGGYKLLRGFNEESIYCNRYGVLGLEYRYLLNRNAFAQLFSDVAFAGNTLTKSNQLYGGTGLGLSLQSQQGILNIAFAVGSTNSAATSNTGNGVKVHIGFVSLF